MIRFKYIDRLPPFLRNKYYVTVLVFLVWIIFLDSNNLIARYREVKELKKLKGSSDYYQEKIEADNIKLRELRTDNHNLEKFAREQYRMKKADEDLYIVLTPQEDRKIRRRNN